MALMTGLMITGLTLSAVGKAFGSAGRVTKNNYERQQKQQELKWQNELLDKQIGTLNTVKTQAKEQHNLQIGQTLSAQSMEAVMNSFTGVELAKQQMQDYKNILAESAFNEGQAIQQSALSGFRDTGSNASLHAGYRESTDGTAEGLKAKDSDIARTYTAIQNRNRVTQAKNSYVVSSAQTFMNARNQYLDKDMRVAALKQSMAHIEAKLQSQIDELTTRKSQNDKRIEGLEWGNNGNWVDDIFDPIATSLDITADILKEF